MESDLFVCACYNVEHQIIFGYDPKWDEIYVSIHLRPDNFFKRIKNAIKYIFGHRSKWGDFDEFIFNDKDIERLKTILNNVSICKKEGSNRL